MIELSASFAQVTVSPAISYQLGNLAYASLWDYLVDTAEEFNNPGRFTTFIAFEWTSFVQGKNSHRNVIFRDGPDVARQILPYTTTPHVGWPYPTDLYTWLHSFEDKNAGDAVAIAHNGNLLDGWMFALVDDFVEGTPAMDQEYRQARANWERLYEWSQIKGDGEAHPF